MDVHIGDIGQVADIAAEDNEALVLDRPRLRTVTHAQIALAAVGAERGEDDPRAFVDEAAGKLRKFAVVTDEHADRAAIGRDRVDRVAALDVPPIALVGGWVDFLLLMDRSVAQADKGDVLDIAVVGARRMRPPDDVDIELHRHVAQRCPDARGVFAQRLDRLHRRQFLLFER